MKITREDLWFLAWITSVCANRDDGFLMTLEAVCHMWKPEKTVQEGILKALTGTLNGTDYRPADVLCFLNWFKRHENKTPLGSVVANLVYRRDRLTACDVIGKFDNYFNLPLFDDCFF